MNARQGESTDSVARRDRAFAELAALEVERVALRPLVNAGDREAIRASKSLRLALSKQAVLAADLDAIVDLEFEADESSDAKTSAKCRSDQEQHILDLNAERVRIAAQIERQVEAVSRSCHLMLDNANAFAAADLASGPVAAELARFGDRFCFYLDTIFDFATGARGLAGHPAYRRLADVMLDGEAILQLFRRTVPVRADDPIES